MFLEVGALTEALPGIGNYDVELGGHYGIHGNLAGLSPMVDYLSRPSWQLTTD